MPGKRIGICMLLLCAVQPASQCHVAAATYSEIVVIGDSLSDVGNINALAQAALGIPIPAPPNLEGRFSNGRVWIERVGDALGLDASTAFLQDGQSKNFAFGGAQVGLQNGAVRDAIAPLVGPDLAEALSTFGMTPQVLWHLEQGGSVDGEELYVLWGGPNDFFQEQLSVNTAEVALTQALNLFLLDAGGARNVLVPNVPPLGQTPRFSDSPAAADLDELVVQYNDQLEIVRQAVEVLTDGRMNLIPLDVHQLYLDFIESPPEGFNVTDSALVDGVIVGDPDFYLYWDDVHPTAATHQLLADEVLDALALLAQPRHSRGKHAPLDPDDLPANLWDTAVPAGMVLSVEKQLQGQPRLDLETALPALADLRRMASSWIAGRGVPEPAAATLAALLTGCLLAGSREPCRRSRGRFRV